MNGSSVLRADLNLIDNVTVINTRDTIENQILRVVAHLPILTIVMALVGNSAAFLIFRLTDEMKNMSSMVYLSFVAVTDTMTLFLWNLDHYLVTIHGFQLEHLSVFNCKLLVFIQYSSQQMSGLLLSMICIDRYFTIIATPGSFVSRLPFGTVKSALIWSTSIVLFLALLNMHILILNGYHEPVTLVVENLTNGTTIAYNKTNNFLCYRYSPNFILAPTWDYVNMALYNFLPYILMSIFNYLLIRKTMSTSRSFRSSNDQQQIKMNRKKMRLTISLVIITNAFIVMTLPGMIAYGFFFNLLYSSSLGMIIGFLADGLLFLNHASLFFICFLSNVKFRQIVIQKFKHLFNLVAKKRIFDTQIMEMTSKQTEMSRTGN